MWNQFVKKVKELGIRGVLMMNLGILCCAVASYIFLSPSKLVASGASGLSIFFESFSGVPYYFFLYGINGALLIVSWPLLGKEFTIKTLYGSLMLPTYGFLIALVCKWTNFNPVTVINSCDAAFVVMFAAALMGLGIGINMRLGGSTGGFDILEAIFLKYLHLQYSVSIFILDIFIIGIGMMQFRPTYENGMLTSLFANAFGEGMAAVVYILIMGFVIDAITFGGYNKRAVFIVSEKHAEIHDYIINKLTRGVTYLEAEGGYSGVSTKMIVSIVYIREYFILREAVSKIDPKAFIFMTRAAEVRGLGFSFETPEHLAQFSKKR